MAPIGEVLRSYSVSSSQSGNENVRAKENFDFAKVPVWLIQQRKGTETYAVAKPDNSQKNDSDKKDKRNAYLFPQDQDKAAVLEGNRYRSFQEYYA